MSDESLVSKLAQFQPRAGSLDRDELLIAVGRTQAPRAVAWKLLTGLCFAGMLTTTILWQVERRTPEPGITDPPGVTDIIPALPAPGGRPPEPSSYGELMRHLDKVGTSPGAPESDIAPAPPLYVGSIRQAEFPD